MRIEHPSEYLTKPIMSVNKFATIGLPINAGLQSSPGNFVPDFAYGIAGREMYDYYWIFICGCVFAFTMAFGIGANDVANSFATSVGARTLKMWQAIIIAGLCEFFGAYLLGARVTATIKGGIVKIDTFEGHDDLLMFGMLCALLCVSIWLMGATFMELPVSTTHSIIGGIIGFGLCSPAGGAAVDWGGIGLIVASWFVSPCLSIIVAGLIFSFVRWAILRRGDSAFDRVFIFFPFLLFVTFTVNVLFIMKKGGVGSGQGLSGGTVLTDDTIVGIAFAVGGGCALLCIVVLNPLMRRSINNMSEAKLMERYAQVTGKVAPVVVDLENGDATGDKTSEVVVSADDAAIATPKPLLHRIEARLDKLFSQDKIYAAQNANDQVAAMHAEGETFPVKAEIAFGFLQVFTASFASFAHGANDVANAIGPLAAIASVYDLGVGGAASKSEVPDWILILGGVGLVIGLATYGHIIIASIGVKMVKITPSRGFSAELSTGFVVVLGSFLGLPLSSTQVAIGSIVGVGLVEGNASKSVNWKFLMRIFSGWISTLVVAGASTALVFSFATFAPSQVYPLSPHNCIAFYGQMKNTTNGDPSTYTQQVDSQGTIAGMFGYPVDGSISLSL
ncbi:hypothetical protein BASA81_011291 [Batrachochytrium salamandrivorans]|nr:hypothetical protein BASA81_011291 [Batrachochytrium salamandrivorans]